MLGLAFFFVYWYAGGMLKRSGVQTRLLDSGLNDRSGTGKWEDGGGGGMFSGIGIYVIGFVLTGVLIAGSFPGLSWMWLAHVALVPGVLVATRAERVKKMYWVCFVVGVLWWAWRLGWLMALTGGGYLLLCLVFGIYWVLSFWGIRVLMLRWKVPGSLALPLVWTSFEYLRGSFPAGGLSWFALGYSQAGIEEGEGAGSLVQLASLFSVYGVSFAVCVSNGLFVDLMTKKLFVGRGKGKQGLSTTIMVSLGMWLIVVFGGSLWGWSFTVERLGEKEGMRVGIVQTNRMSLPSAEREDVGVYFKKVQEMVMGLDGEFDLVVLPESASVFAINREAVVADIFSGLAKGGGFDLMLGGGYQSADKRYNSVYLFGADGVMNEKRYDKVALVPFGEYVPWVGDWGWAMGMLNAIAPFEDYRLDRGERTVVYELDYDAGEKWGGKKRVKIVTPICFEDVVGKRTREMVYGEGGEKQGELLVNLTNDGWYTGDRQRLEHFQIAVVRSIENRVPTVRSVNTGVSGIIDANGTVLKKAGQYEWTVVKGNVREHLGRSLFGDVGYLPLNVMVVFTGLLLGLGFLKSEGGE